MHRIENLSLKDVHFAGAHGISDAEPATTQVRRKSPDLPLNKFVIVIVPPEVKYDKVAFTFTESCARRRGVTVPMKLAG